MNKKMLEALEKLDELDPLGPITEEEIEAARIRLANLKPVVGDIEKHKEYLRKVKEDIEEE